MSGESQRLLLVEMGTAAHLVDGIAAATGWAVDTLESRSVDLGQFGGPTVSHSPEALPVWPSKPYVYAMYGPGLKRRLRQTRPDVVLCLGEPSELGVAQVVWAARRVVPSARLLVWSYENVDRQWPRFPGKLRGRALAATLPRLDGALAYSESAATVLRAQGLPADRLAIAYPPLDEVTFTADGPRRDLPRPPGGLALLYAGRLVHEKGLDLALEALAGLPPSVTLSLAGDGPCRTDLEEQARAAGVADRTHWLGRLTPTELAAAMRGADALLLPSRTLPVWQEQFGMVMAQAMACGTPVVGSATGAIPEVIGAGGLTFANEDAGDLRQALLTLLEQPERRTALAAAALTSARERFGAAAYQAGLRAALHRLAS